MANDGTVKIGTEVDESGFKSGLSKLGGVAKTALAGVTAATTAASAAVGALAKQSLEAYGNYEQLIGGVETLFKESASVVEEYANNAYKTAGLSANQYMETVTGFSASLLQSLGGDTAAAADIADQAIIDMADNANKMGTSMESIQNAYQGFAKQNYTMLDNLKLGYGGTKEEMERLLADAEQISGIHFDISSFADVVQAIHVIQDDLGITGTTAEEAASTIQGSLASMSAAWQNLVTGIADENADLDTLIDNFVESVATAADNILPRLEQILSGIGELVVKLAPIIAEQLPQMITSVLPSLLTAGAQLIEGLIEGITSALPTLVEAAVPILLSLVEAILGQLPAIADAALQIITTLADGLSEALPDLIPAIVDVVLQIVETLTQPDTLTSLIDAALQIILALAEGLIKAIPQLIAAVPQIIANLIAAIMEAGPQLGVAALELLIALGEGLIAAIPQLLSYVIQIPAAILGGIKDGLEGLAEIGPDIIKGLADGILSMGSWLQEQISGFFSGLVDGVKDLLGIHSPSTVFAEIGENMALGLVEGWDDESGNFEDEMAGSMDGLSDALSGDMEKYVEIGRAIADGILQGLQEAWDNLVKFVTDGIENLLGSVSSFLGLGGGSSGGSTSSRSSSRMAAPSATPMALSEGGEDGGVSTYDMSRARARAVTALEGAIPAAQSRMTVATAAMAPAAGYSAPPAAGGQGSGGNGQPVQIIDRRPIIIKAEGDLAPLAQLFKPALDAENARVGAGVQ